MAEASVRITTSSSEYQKQMKLMIAQMKELGSESNLTATQMKLFGTTQDNLKSQVEQANKKVELQEKVVKTNKDEVARLENALKKAKDEYSKTSTKLDEARKKHEEVAKAEGKDSDAAKALQKQISELEKDLAKNDNTVQKLSKSLENQKTKTNNSQIALEKMKKAASELDKQLRDFKLDELSKKFDNVSNKAETFSKKTALVSGAAAALDGACIKAALSFEDSMAKVSTIMDTQQVSYNSMKDAIIDLSNETGIAAGDIAEDVYSAISAGQSTADAVNFVRQSTKLATAGFAESSQSLDILTTIMNAYHLEAEDVTKVSDQLIMTQNLGKTTVGELASSMGKVIPTANANSVALDQVTTSYVKLTANGIATAESTTYLNSMLNELGKTGSVADKVLREKTGKSFKQLMEDGHSLGDVLEILDGAAKENNLSLSDMFSSSEAAKAGLVLLSDGADGFNKTLGQMNNSTGATDDAFKKMQTNSMKLKIMWNQVKNTAIDFGTTLLTAAQPAIDTVVTKVKDLTAWFNDLDEDTKTVIGTATLFVAALAPAAMAVSKLSSGISSAIKFYKDFKGAFDLIKGSITKHIAGLGLSTTAQVADTAAKGAGTAATGGLTAATTALSAAIKAHPLMAFVTAITAVVTAIVLLYNNCEWFRNMVNGLFEWIKTAVANVATTVTTWFENVKTSISNIWTSISTTITSAWNTIKSVVQVGIMFIVELIKGAFTLITLPFQFIWENCKTTITSAFNAIKTTVSTAINAVKTTLTTVLNAIKTTFTTIFNAIKTTVSNVINNIKTNISTVFNAIKTTLTTILNAIKTTVSTVFNGIKSAITTVINAVKSIITTVFNAIKNAIATPINSAKSIVTNVFKSIKSAIATPINSAKSTVSSVFNGIKSTISSAVNSAKSTVSSVFNSIKKAMTSPITAAKNTISSLVNSIKRVFNFSWSLPKLKMPHLKITGGFSLVPPKVPKFSVQWYAQGGIMTNPTLFGMNGNTLLGGGEAGDEAILPLKYFYNELSNILDKKIGQIQIHTYYKVVANTYIGNEEVANATAAKVSQIMAEEYEGVR